MSLDRQHILHYAIVVGIVSLGVASFILFAANRDVQFVIVIAIALFYLAYGILHHSLEHDLTFKIVVEYTLIALLVIVLFLFVRGGF
jgi:hypothetical protein